jgi:hypothetical protein
MDAHRLDRCGSAATPFAQRRLSRRGAVHRLGGVGLAALLGAGGRPLALAAQQGTPDAGAGLYLVIRRYPLAPGASVEELTEIVRAGFVPIVSQVPGFREYYTYDVGNGDSGTISVFTDAAAADESTRRAADWVAPADLGRFFAGPPEMIAGTVLLHVEADEEVGTPAP